MSNDSCTGLHRFVCECSYSFTRNTWLTLCWIRSIFVWLPMTCSECGGLRYDGNEGRKVAFGAIRLKLQRPFGPLQCAQKPFRACRRCWSSFNISQALFVIFAGHAFVHCFRYSDNKSIVTLYWLVNAFSHTLRMPKNFHLGFRHCKSPARLLHLADNSFNLFEQGIFVATLLVRAPSLKCGLQTTLDNLQSRAL